MEQETYQITNQTIALLPAKAINHQTIVIEPKTTYKVKKTPLELIKDACMANWSTYEGSVTAKLK